MTQTEAINEMHSLQAKVDLALERAETFEQVERVQDLARVAYYLMDGQLPIVLSMWVLRRAIDNHHAGHLPN